MTALLRSSGLNNGPDTADGVVRVTVESRSDQLLPDPEPRPVEFTIISVDDHLVEPPDMFEGGIGWVAMLLDRLDNIVTRSGYGRHFDAGGLTPADVLRRNFYFCTLDDPSTIDTRQRIGLDHIMVEVDSPHGDSTWPDTQQVIRDAWGHIPTDDIRMLTHENAARLFRWPLPAVCVP